MELTKRIYNKRFSTELQFKNELWDVLCTDFFQKYISEDAAVLDIGAGYCEFINNIKAKQKTALDINPDVNKFAAKDVKIIISESGSIKQIKDKTIDVVFASNFFEHIPKKDIVRTIREMNRILKTEGKCLILQPNFRYCHKDYWMFFDHITPLDDRCMIEILEVNGFEVIECKPKFLPYSTKSNIPKSPLFI